MASVLLQESPCLDLDAAQKTEISCYHPLSELLKENNHLLYEAEQVGEEGVWRGEERQAYRQQLPTDGDALDDGGDDGDVKKLHDDGGDAIDGIDDDDDWC